METAEKNMVSIKDLFGLIIDIDNEYRAYLKASWDLDTMFKVKPKECFIFIDAYDLCDLFYPREMSDDKHYDTVNFMWTEFFSLMQHPRMPFEIHAVIPPGGALEIIHFTQKKLKHASSGWIPSKSKLKGISDKEMNKLLNRAWSSYLHLQPFLERLSAQEHFSKLAGLFTTKKFIEFGDILKKSNLDKSRHGDLRAVTTNLCDYKKGMNALNARRPYKQYSNKVDMHNLLTTIAIRKDLKKPREDFLFIDSHSGPTLYSWFKSWKLRDAMLAPARPSLTSNIIVNSIVNKKGDLVEARDFTIFAKELMYETLSELRNLPYIKEYYHSTQDQRSEMRKKLKVAKKEIPVHPFLASRILKISEFLLKKRAQSYLVEIGPTDREIAEKYLLQENLRKQIIEEASFNAKSVFNTLRKEGVLDLNRTFIPEEPETEEILGWLSKA